MKQINEINEKILHMPTQIKEISDSGPLCRHKAVKNHIRLGERNLIKGKFGQAWENCLFS